MYPGRLLPLFTALRAKAAQNAVRFTTQEDGAVREREQGTRCVRPRRRGASRSRKVRSLYAGPKADTRGGPRHTWRASHRSRLHLSTAGCHETNWTELSLDQDTNRLALRQGYPIEQPPRDARMTTKPRCKASHHESGVPRTGGTARRCALRGEGRGDPL